MSTCSSYVSAPKYLCGIEVGVDSCLRGERKKRLFLFMTKIQEQNKVWMQLF